VFCDIRPFIILVHWLAVEWRKERRLMPLCLFRVHVYTRYGFFSHPVQEWRQQDHVQMPPPLLRLKRTALIWQNDSAMYYAMQWFSWKTCIANLGTVDVRFVMLETIAAVLWYTKVQSALNRIYETTFSMHSTILPIESLQQYRLAWMARWYNSACVECNDVESGHSRGQTKAKVRQQQRRRQQREETTADESTW